jgi:polyphosphate kinase 2 (PPK2 family)
MFESAELGHAISKQTYARQVPKLRESLLDAQYDLFQDGRFPVIVLIGGMDGAGKGETVNLLNEWMDPRHIRTMAFGEPSDEERERPPTWRYWQALPPKGKIGILFGHWYTQAILDRVKGEARHSHLVQCIEDIVRFEQMLSDEGALVLKFWFHLSKVAQKKRLKTMEKDPKTRWKVSDTEWADFKLYDKFRKVAEFTLRQTTSATAPWIVVEGVDACYRNLTVGRTLLAAMRERLDQKPAKVKEDRIPPLAPAIDNRNIVKSLDPNLKLERSKYEKLLDDYRARLNLLSRHPRFRNRLVVLAFEGNDAAGKGGAIRRVTRALDARQYRIVPVAAPTEEERVQRVEGLASEFDWTRAYPEINDFEQQLADNGAIVIKFWLAISKEEQYRRFKEREKTAFKRFKITPEDWRNRKKWDAYEKAVCDMVDRTSTDIAPWTLVEANDKLYARAKVLRTICDRMEAGLKRTW